MARVEPLGLAGSHELVDSLARELHHEPTARQHREDLPARPQPGHAAEAGTFADIRVLTERAGERREALLRTVIVHGATS
ncbi:MAG: hypothetical protein M3P48_07045 [Actinomycetota bacterium]|nr:hypothetical protein [Actinomycetota bacterium]